MISRLRHYFSCLFSLIGDMVWFASCRPGLESFLQGDNEVVEEIEYRGEQVPVPIVDNIEQLKEQQAASSSTNGKEQIGEEPEAKKEKKESKESAPPPPTTASEIDVSKLDIRVGLITKAWEHEDADKLFCEEIDIGEAQPRSIASGLRAHYDLSDLEGQRVLVLANLKSRNMLGFPSHGMVLCASASDGDGVAGTVRFIEPPPDAAIGERVMVDGFDGEPATENQVIKKKMLEVIFPDLKTNADGVPCYKGVPLSTSAGNCKSNLPNSVIV
jgi:aminoacyl tRNA synthase complex-interacting multifunctional protein 1